MKKHNDDLWDNLLEQLIEDLQSILRMQLDHQFAFGFTFGPSQLTIWMHDRSGVLGMETSVNIHKVGRRRSFNLDDLEFDIYRTPRALSVSSQLLLPSLPKSLVLTPTWRCTTRPLGSPCHRTH